MERNKHKQCACVCVWLCVMLQWIWNRILSSYRSKSLCVVSVMTWAACRGRWQTLTLIWFGILEEVIQVGNSWELGAGTELKPFQTWKCWNDAVCLWDFRLLPRLSSSHSEYTHAFSHQFPHLMVLQSEFCCSSEDLREHVNDRTGFSLINPRSWKEWILRITWRLLVR